MHYNETHSLFSKGYTMSESTAVVNKAAKAAGAAAAAVSEVLPTVVETTQIAAEVPTKIVLKQPLIVTAAVLAGVAAGAGALYGWNWFRNRNNVVTVFPKPRDNGDEHVEESVKTA
jgi:hypothetical protein